MTHLSSGELKEGIFHFPVRVYYEDTDQQGIVFYANYLRYLERARTEFLRYLDCPPTQVEALYDRVFVVAHLDISYHSPAKLDEVLMVQTCVSEFGRVRLVMEQNIYIYEGDRLIASATVTLAIINGQGRPARLNQEVEDLLRVALKT